MAVIVTSEGLSYEIKTAKIISIAILMLFCKIIITTTIIGIITIIINKYLFFTIQFNSIIKNNNNCC